MVPSNTAQPNTVGVEIVTQPPTVVYSYADFTELIARIQTPYLRSNDRLYAQATLCSVISDDNLVPLWHLGEVTAEPLSLPPCDGASDPNGPWSYFRFDLSKPSNFGEGITKPFKFGEGKWCIEVRVCQLRHGRHGADDGIALIGKQMITTTNRFSVKAISRNVVE